MLTLGVLKVWRQSSQYLLPFSHSEQAHIRIKLHSMFRAQLSSHECEIDCQVSLK